MQEIESTYWRNDWNGLSRETFFAGMLLELSRRSYTKPIEMRNCSGSKEVVKDG